jgi:hypothetical protein
MTDPRAKRTQTLIASARARSQAKTKAAEQAIRALTKRGEPINFQAVQREAGVPTRSSITTPTCADASNACEPRVGRSSDQPLRLTRRQPWSTR